MGRVVFANDPNFETISQYNTDTQDTGTSLTVLLGGKGEDSKCIISKGLNTNRQKLSNAISCKILAGLSFRIPTFIPPTVVVEVGDKGVASWSAVELAVDAPVFHLDRKEAIDETGEEGDETEAFEDPSCDIRLSRLLVFPFGVTVSVRSSMAKHWKAEAGERGVDPVTGQLKEARPFAGNFLHCSIRLFSQNWEDACRWAASAAPGAVLVLPRIWGKTGGE